MGQVKTLCGRVCGSPLLSSIAPYRAPPYRLFFLAETKQKFASLFQPCTLSSVEIPSARPSSTFNLKLLLLVSRLVRAAYCITYIAFGDALGVRLWESCTVYARRRPSWWIKQPHPELLKKQPSTSAKAMQHGRPRADVIFTVQVVLIC